MPHTINKYNAMQRLSDESHRHRATFLLQVITPHSCDALGRQFVYCCDLLWTSTSLLPTKRAGETNRTLTVEASIPVNDAECGFRAGCGSAGLRETGKCAPHTAYVPFIDAAPFLTLFSTLLASWTVRSPPVGGARNAILFVADGMSLPMLSAGSAVKINTDSIHIQIRMLMQLQLQS